jgi:hypothetical protein
MFPVTMIVGYIAGAVLLGVLWEGHGAVSAGSDLIGQWTHVARQRNETLS